MYFCIPVGHYRFLYVALFYQFANNIIFLLCSKPDALSLKKNIGNYHCVIILLCNCSYQNGLLLRLAFEHKTDCNTNPAVDHQPVFSMSSIQRYFLSKPIDRKCHMSIESNQVQIRHPSDSSSQRNVFSGSSSIRRLVNCHSAPDIGN